MELPVLHIEGREAVALANAIAEQTGRPVLSTSDEFVLACLRSAL